MQPIPTLAMPMVPFSALAAWALCGGNEAPYSLQTPSWAANTRGACPPAQGDSQLKQFAFIFASFPAHTDRFLPSIFMTPFIHEHSGLALKHFLLWPTTT